jgi:lysophospholipase L1-like esterase
LTTARGGLKLRRKEQRMNLRSVTSFVIILLLGAACSFAQSPPATAPVKPLKIVIIGDSTVCNYPPEHTNRGWGMYIEEQFKPGTVKVVNLAASGRSTKTFIQEGRWTKALAEKPDFVLIQFGHNDSHAPTNPEATDFAGDYKDYLRRYIDESRAIGAKPILVTPMVRRTFDAQGKIAEAQAGNRPLSAYAGAVREVAAEKKAPLIDLYASSKALAERIGVEASHAMNAKPSDVTHFNEKGARAIANLVIEDLPAAAPTLAGQLKTR